MAKVKGPLFSLEASGALAKTIVFSIWKGRPYVRELVNPSNPSSAGQVAIRLILGGVAKAAKGVLTQLQDTGANVGSPFYVAARDLAPSGQSWISFLQQNASEITSKMTTQWALIDATEKGYFETEAALQGMVDYAPILGGVQQATLTAGQQLMMLAYFAQDFLSFDVLSILGVSPTEADVQTFGAKVGETV